MTEKTELALFLLEVVSEFDCQAVDMWDTTLTVQDRLGALRSAILWAKLCKFSTLRETERGQLVCDSYKTFKSKKMEIDIFVLMVRNIHFLEQL